MGVYWHFDQQLKSAQVATRWGRRQMRIQERQQNRPVCIEIKETKQNGDKLS